MKESSVSAENVRDQYRFAENYSDSIFQFRTNMTGWAYNSFNISVYGAAFKDQAVYNAALRERYRFIADEYKPLDLTFKNLKDLPFYDKLTTRVSDIFGFYPDSNMDTTFLFSAPMHFLHRSVKVPGMIAYTASDDKLIRDLQSPMKFGKYLTEFHSDWLTAPEIAEIANIFKRIHTPPELFFARTREEIADVYMRGPGSCMGGKDAEHFLSDAHPTEAYASGDFACAYIKEADRIVSRCITDEVNKEFVRGYGNVTLIVSALKDAGYKHVCDYREGLRFLKIEEPDGYVGPYIDGDDSWTIYAKRGCDKFLYLGDGDEAVGGSRNSHETRGFFTECRRSSCNWCDDSHHEDDLEDGYCGHCRENNLEMTVDEGWCDRNDCVYTEGGDVYSSTRAARRAGYVQLDNGDWYHQDDCVVDDVSGDYILENDAVEAVRDTGETCMTYCDNTTRNLFGERLVDADSDYVSATGIVGGKMVEDQTPESRCSQIEGSDVYIHQDTEYGVIRYVNENLVLINLEGHIIEIAGEFEDQFAEQQEAEQENSNESLYESA